MSDGFPIGMRIARVGGMITAVREKPYQREYVALLRFDDGSVGELYEACIERGTDWPASASDIPIQAPSGESRLVGCTVTGAVMRAAREDIGRRGRPQLFLILDGVNLLGLVPTKLGNIVHIEPILTSPLIRADHELTLMNGERVSLDELVFT